jgi:hypothetical protein
LTIYKEIEPDAKGAKIHDSSRAQKMSTHECPKHGKEDCNRVIGQTEMTEQQVSINLAEEIVTHWMLRIPYYVTHFRIQKEHLEYLKAEIRKRTTPKFLSLASEENRAREYPKHREERGDDDPYPTEIHMCTAVFDKHEEEWNDQNSAVALQEAIFGFPNDAEERFRAGQENTKD